ncbi:hypothetical protein HDU98_007451 [Podochytrium sp. JEL0797]|nr:hypothetical protein HDU98_007451 [Podochytrium sp. JEL0797]
MEPAPTCLTFVDFEAKVHVSFTGGKDSVLALTLIQQTLAHLQVQRLVTFTPITDTAHPEAFIAAQAEALGFPTERFLIGNTPSYLESYRSHMAGFVANDGVSLLATGDIEDIGHGFMAKAAHPTGLRIFSPLFGRDRDELLHLFNEYRLRPLITLISLNHVPEDVARRLIGRFLDEETIAIMRNHNKRVENGEFAQNDANGKLNKHHLGIDLCGENGEYHTMCLDGATFAKRVCLVDLKTGAEVDGSQVPPKVLESEWGNYLHLDYTVGEGIGFELRNKD